MNDNDKGSTRMSQAKTISDFLSKEILVPGNYGKFTVQVQNGKVVAVKYERSYLVDDLSVSMK